MMQLYTLLYNIQDKNDKALFAFEESLRLRDEEGVIDKEVSECLLYLAKVY